MQIIDELRDSELNSSQDIEVLCKNIQTLCRDLYEAVYYASEIIYANLSRVPGSAPRIKAKLVAGFLKKSAEAIHLAGSLAVKCHRSFIMKYAEELDSAKRPQARKPFEF